LFTARRTRQIEVVEPPALVEVGALGTIGQDYQPYAAVLMHVAREQLVDPFEREVGVLFGDQPLGRDFHADEDVALAILARTRLEEALQDLCVLEISERVDLALDRTIQD
jgi:hypothetical protein